MERFTFDGTEVINHLEMHNLLQEKISSEEDLLFIAKCFLACVDNLKKYAQEDEFGLIGEVMEPEERNEMLDLFRKCIAN